MNYGWQGNRTGRPAIRATIVGLGSQLARCNRPRAPVKSTSRAAHIRLARARVPGARAVTAWSLGRRARRKKRCARGSIGRRNVHGASVAGRVRARKGTARHAVAAWRRAADAGGDRNRRWTVWLPGSYGPREATFRDAGFHGQWRDRVRTPVLSAGVQAGSDLRSGGQLPGCRPYGSYRGDSRPARVLSENLCVEGE
jgi:hypothetical protein